MNPFAELVRRYLADEPYRQLSDDDLWVRFRDHRDETAFRVFLDRCGARIYLRCKALLGEDALAEDAFQETFAELVRHAAKLPGYGAAVAWLYQTATYKALQMARARRRAILHEVRAAAPAEVAATGEAELAAWERQRTLAAALVRLPATQRRVIELVYLEGMTHTEAGDVLGVARSAVGTHVRRGLERLRKNLGGVTGLTVFGATTIESALLAHSLPLDRGLAYHLADGAWARAALLPTTAGPWWLTWKPLAVGAAGLGLVLGGAALMWWPDGAAGTAKVTEANDGPASTAPPAERESLQARNVRVTTAEIAPPLRDLLQRFYPPPHRVGEPVVRAVGSEVELEFQVTPPPPAVFGLAARLRGRYCLVLRRLTVRGQPHGESKWYWMDPERPLVFRVPLPGGAAVELVRGREEFVASEKLFSQLPPDDRAEPDQIRALFGEPTDAVRLPSETRGVAGFPGGLVMATGDGALFVRDGAGWWRAAGECPGWNPVTADGWVYCYTHGMIRSRPLNNPAAPWEKWCDEPPLAPGDSNLGDLFVAGGQLFITVKPQGLHSRPLKDPTTGWKRSSHTLSPIGVAEAKGTLFGHDGERLFKRPVAQPDVAWVPVGQWPAGYDRFFADGDHLVAYAWGPGPIYSRPVSAGPDVPWAEVGQVHDPYRR